MASSHSDERRLRLKPFDRIRLEDCDREEYELWDTMITWQLRELKASRSPDDYKDIEAMHNLWLKYKEMRFKVGVSEFGHRSGTRNFLESNVRAVTTIKHQALFLRSLAGKDDY